MSLVFPLPFDGDTPALVVLDSSGYELNDTLDENTYASFGTIPKGGSSTLKLYVKNTGATPIYSVKCEGLASSNQLGEAANTYEAVDLPQELGNIDPRETIELEVVWTIPTDAPVGMKVFGLKVTDSTYLAISENHDYFTKITITNNDTDLLLDFPIEIDFDVDSIDWSKTTSDGRDLRFYDENLNELSYYIETWTPATTTGKVWVRVPKIIGGETIYLYLGYGNFDLYSASDLYAKYEFYDDFDGVFANDYSLVGSPSYEFSGGLLLKGGCATNTADGIYFPLPTPNSRLIVEGEITTGRNALAAHTWYHTLFFEANLITKRVVGDYGYGVMSYKDSNSSTTDAKICVANVATDVAETAGTTYTFKTICNQGSYTGYLDEVLKGTYVASHQLPTYLRIFTNTSSTQCTFSYIGIYKYCPTAMTIAFATVADITAEFTNPNMDSGIICVIGNVARQLAFHDYDFKKIIYEVGYNNAYWRVPGTSGGIYVWGKLEMRPLYGEDVSFVDNLYANDAYFYTFTDYTYDIHDKLDVEGVLYDIQAIQVHDAGSETIYKTLVLKRQPEYYACCVGVVS